jgi:hypothetical protein
MRLAEEPLTKVTLNLFTSDVEYIKARTHDQWTVEIRNVIRSHVRLKRRLHLDGIARSQIEDADHE